MSNEVTGDALKFETKPLDQYPLPKNKPVTGSWRYEGKKRPYKVIDIDSLTRAFRIAVSRIYNMGGKADSRGMISSETFMSIHETTKALWEHNIAVAVNGISDNDIADVRNTMVTYWYDSVPTTHLLFIDDDMGFKPELVLDMLSLDKPLVGAAYRQRQDKITWTIGDIISSEIKNTSPESMFLEVSAIGGGVMLIRKDVIESMLQTLPNLEGPISNSNTTVLTPVGIKRTLRCFDRIETEQGTMGEDFAFCKRYRDCGGEVWASISHDVTHVGKKAWTGNYFEYLNNL